MSYDLHLESTASGALPLESVTVKMTLGRRELFIQRCFTQLGLQRDRPAGLSCLSSQSYVSPNYDLLYTRVYFLGSIASRLRKSGMQPDHGRKKTVGNIRYEQYHFLKAQSVS